MLYKFSEVACGICFMLIIVAGCFLDGEIWLPFLAVIVVAALGCYGFYKLGEWADERDL